MRESRTYGSGRGACHEMHVPTATSGASSSRCSAARRRRGRSRRARSSRAMPVIGFSHRLSTIADGCSAAIARAFGRVCSELGYVEGQQRAIEYRWAEGRSRTRCQR